MTKLIDLNTATPEAPQPLIQKDWLEVVTVGSGSYRFGFWEIALVTKKKKELEETDLIFKGVSKTGLFSILEVAGYAKRYRPDGSYILLREKDNILSMATPAQIKDFCISLVNSLPNSLQVQGFTVTSERLKEIFFNQHHVLFGENVLSPLRNNDSKMLADTAREMYFPFLNVIAKVTTTGVEVIQYPDLKGLCIWDSHIIQRNFIISDSKAMFADFITNVCNSDFERIRAMRCAFGYAMHRYYSGSNTRAIVMYDEQVTDSDSANGGTGKSLAAIALSKMRQTETIDGKKFDANERFSLQRVTEQTEIVFFDDIKPDFEFERFNSILTNGWETEAKNQKSLRIDVEKSPKMLIASNSIMRCKDGNTASRRQYILEFSDYYSKLIDTVPKPIQHIHGCEFFTEWNAEQWNAFDNWMIESCIDYLANGLPIQKTMNVEYNRLLQATSQDFVTWVTEQDFQVMTDYHFNQKYIEFKSLFYGENSHWSSKTFSTWLKMYAKTGGHTYETHRFNTVTYMRFKKKQS
jgi:hypothetical protein